MSKIGVALALCVLLLGAVLVIGNGVATQAVDRGNDIGASLSDANLGVNQTSGAITIDTP
ncbi:hypothetical protein [Paenibacillus sp.]|uniref:hypothetical protein n=1 Tax=Paenibacillus sp. TaxID=58172 RepID=UPI002D549B7D|nr:hypothetical protein [Paenibacillus sp.]HZG86140.1 hypothetical protein [Paenibacillus sp.]